MQNATTEQYSDQELTTHFMISTVLNELDDITLYGERLTPLPDECPHNDVVYHQYVMGGSTKCQECGEWIDEG